jgi:hypothetical protein
MNGCHKEWRSLCAHPLSFGQSLESDLGVDVLLVPLGGTVPDYPFFAFANVGPLNLPLTGAAEETAQRHST